MSESDTSTLSSDNDASSDSDFSQEEMPDDKNSKYIILCDFSHLNFFNGTSN